MILSRLERKINPTPKAKKVLKKVSILKLMQINQCYKWTVCNELNAMKCYVFQVWLWESLSYGMGTQGLGRVHLGVALRSTYTYCTLSAITLSIHRICKWV